MNERWFRWSEDRSTIRVLRLTVREQLESWSVGEAETDRVVLVVDELANNSLDHAESYREDGNQPSIKLSIEAGVVELAFVDPDVPPDLVFELERRFAELAGPPQLDDERGRGLYLVQQALENVTFSWVDGVGMTLAGRLRGPG